MSAWEADTISNDPAADYFIEVVDAKDGWKVIQRSLEKALQPTDEELEIRAIAAAEIVAAAAGSPVSNLPEEIAEFARSVLPAQLSELKLTATAAVTRIRSKSDLKRLWEETADYSDYSKWMAAVEDLVRRLAHNGPVAALNARK